MLSQNDKNAIEHKLAKWSNRNPVLTNFFMLETKNLCPYKSNIDI